MATGAGDYHAVSRESVRPPSRRKLRPAEHYVDAAYVDALLLASEQKKGIETVGPARPDPSWQSKTEGAYSVDQFKIDWKNEQVICPQGKASRKWKAHTRPSGDPYIHVTFRRRSRYIEQAKTHLQNVAAGAALNIDRLFNWFQGAELAKTRVSHFSALKPV